MTSKVLEIPVKKEPKNKEVATKPPPKKRVITSTKKWTFSEYDLSPENQSSHIKFLGNHNNCNSKEMDETQEHITQFIQTQIRDKIAGYKYQDIKKDIYDDVQFVDFNTVLDIMRRADLKCFYCKEPVLVLYEHVRDLKQWTIERLDNTRGHNCDNAEIACLGCNLRRRTMYHERYLFTKQLNIVKCV